MSLRYALLGLLAHEPASGYGLTKYFERNVGRYAWHAKHTQIYPELNRLADEGCIEVVEEGPRGRRTYALTDTGRAQLRRWLLQPKPKSGVRNESVLRMFLVTALDAEDAQELLRRQIDRASQELERLRAMAEEIDRKGARSGFGRLAAEFGLRQYQSTQEWAKWAMGRLGDAEIGEAGAGVGEAAAE